MVVPGATARRGGLVASHQLAEQLEQGEAQWARRHARLAALRAQHLQLDRLRARTHPRRYRRAMPRTAARGHSGLPPGEPRTPMPLAHTPVRTTTRGASLTRASSQRGADTPVRTTLAPSQRRAQLAVLPFTFQCFQHQEILLTYFWFRSLFSLNKS